MKTTSGKITGPKESREERVIKIYAVEGRRTIAQFNAKSLKQALIDYYENNWVPKGAQWKMKIVGNTMQVFNGKGSVHNYRALEIYQAP